MNDSTLIAVAALEDDSDYLDAAIDALSELTPTWECTCSDLRNALLPLVEAAGGNTVGVDWYEVANLVASNAGLEAKVQEAPAQPSISKENPMSQKAFSTVDYIYGQDVTQMSDEQLIGALRRIDGEIKSLDEVAASSGSQKLADKLEALKAQKASIVAVLDGVDAKVAAKPAKNSK